MENILVQQQINELFASYRKSLSKLFTDYSATKEFDKLEKFDNYKPLKNRMNAGETVRFLRDHSISELFVIPDEVVMIIREVNCKTYSNNFSYSLNSTRRMPLSNIYRIRTIYSATSSTHIKKVFL